MRKKTYFIPGVDELKQLVETPASKEKTERERFAWSIAASAISAVAAIVAAIAAILTYIRL